MSAATANTSAILGGEPRVDLLPPEVHAAVGARKTRRLLGVLVVLAIVVAVAGVAFASVQATAAQAALDAANAKTTSLLQARVKYATASSVAAQLSATQQALKENASTEVLWGDMYKQVQKLLPDGASITGGDFKARMVTDPTFLPAGPLRAASHVASMSVTVTGLGIPQSANLLDVLTKMPGVVDATLDSVTHTSGPYVSIFTLDLNESALSGRFQTATTGSN